MFPLSKRKLIRGAMAHIKAGLGAGADYEAVYTGFKIPFDGIAKKYHGTEGGNWLRVTRPNGDQIELAHLSEYQVSDGTVKEGQNGGITGNTGSITTGPHLHIQIIRSGKRLDPEKYDWGDSKLNDGTMNYYIERPSKIDPAKTEIGVAIDQGEQTTILWATDEAWGDQMSKHFKPSGVYKIIKK